MSTQEENKVSVQNSGLTKDRRSFIKKSAIAAPIIASISSRPVWASVSSAVSGNLSGNLSQPSGVTFPGQSPGYWQGSNTDRIAALGLTNPATGQLITGSSLFKDIFTDAPAPYNTYTFFQILHGNGDAQQPSRFSAAAYFNTYYHADYPLSRTQILGFYSIYVANQSIEGPILHNLYVNLTH